MGTMYAICLVVGGVLVLTSVLFGGADLEADVDMDADFDIDADIDVDADLDIDGHVDIHHHGADIDTGIWLPFLSLRFWIFFSAFFGLTGTVLTLLQSALEVNSLMLHISSIGMGLIAGTGSAYAFRWLQQRPMNSMVTQKQFIGKTAQVMLPITSSAKGKIKIEIGGERIEMIASTDEGNSFERGDEAFIFQISDGEAKVVPPHVLKSGE